MYRYPELAYNTKLGLLLAGAGVAAGNTIALLLALPHLDPNHPLPWLAIALVLLALELAGGLAYARRIRHSYRYPLTATAQVLACYTAPLLVGLAASALLLVSHFAAVG